MPESTEPARDQQLVFREGRLAPTHSALVGHERSFDNGIQIVDNRRLFPNEVVKTGSLRFFHAIRNR
jgi:hypothetical protein